MVKGRKLKTKLQRFTIATTATTAKPTVINHHANDISASNSGVSRQLAKLRSEQLRAIRNQSLRRHGSASTDSRDPCYLGREGMQRAEQEGKPQIALPTGHQTVPSLTDLCAERLVPLLNEWVAIRKADRLRQVKTLPVSLRQRLLRHCIMTDRLLDIFKDSDYGELTLEGASITFGRLLQSFWRIDAIQPQTPARELQENWEDEEYDSECYEDGFLYHPEDYNDHTPHMRELFQILIPRLDLSKCYRLFTPLSQKLVSLNLSFVHPLMPAAKMAHLIVNTLPDLLSLSLAGSLKADEGPEAVLVLSRYMKKLQYWDLGYHPWLEAHILCMQIPHCGVQWTKTLLCLKTLCLHRCGSGSSGRTGRAVSNWFHNQSKDDSAMRHVRNIRVLWDDEAGSL